MREPVDVLIIGAGASAAAFAWSMADTRMRIVCLEQGGWPDHTSYPAHDREWEGRDDFSSDPNVRRSLADYPVNNIDSDISVANFNGVGGGTVLFAGHFPRFHPSDFKVRTLDGVADDWPIDYELLEPYYQLNDKMMGVSGLSGDPAYPEKLRTLPPIPLGRSGSTMAGGFNSLGWHWWPSDCAILTEERDGRAACINLGLCGLGCAQGAKGSVDVTYWPIAIRAGVEIVTDARVREIEVNDKGLATGAVYYDANGEEQRIEAHMVVVACNGIGTPRLLLNSKSKLFPDGLANSSGLVGKNLMFHPYAGVDGVFPEDLDGLDGPHKSIASHQFYETDTSRDFTRGFSFEMHRGFGAVSTALIGLQTGAVSWGNDHHDSFRSMLNRTMSLIAICEDLPEQSNQVTLDDTLTDSSGIPAAKISYRLSSNSRDMIEFSIARAKEVLEAAGAAKILRAYGPVEYAGWHHMGTARMGNDPETSVVNKWGRAHDVKNLFIIDGSVFVTSAAVNPTSTIQAIALYIADQIKERLADASLFD